MRQGLALTLHCGHPEGAYGRQIAALSGFHRVTHRTLSVWAGLEYRLPEDNPGLALIATPEQEPWTDRCRFRSRSSQEPPPVLPGCHTELYRKGRGR